jgi:hypothetical protein
MSIAHVHGAYPFEKLRFVLKTNTTGVDKYVGQYAVTWSCTVGHIFPLCL